MTYRSLLRYKGLVLATAMLLVIVFLYALISISIENRQASYARAVSSFSEIATLLTNSSVGISDQQAKAAFSEFERREAEGIKQQFGSALAQIQTSLAENRRADANQQTVGLLQQLQSELTRKAKLSDYIHWIIIIIAVLVYLLAVLPQIARLSKEESVEVESNKEARNILGTVSEGLFLLGKDHEIGIEQSASLKELFRSEKDLEGNFFDFIGQYVPESTVSVAKDYLDLLYGDRVKENLVKDLNPLNEVEIHIARRDGSYESRYLDFRFNRVVEEGKLSHLLGSVTDVTREVLLRKELEDTKEEQEAQLDLLMRVLHLDQASLLAFFERSDQTLGDINATLEERGHSNEEIRSKIKSIAERAHRIKGDAAALGLHSFEFSMHEFESELDKAQNTSERLTGRDLLPAVTCLKSAFTELDNMRRIVSRFSEAILAEKKLPEATHSADEAKQTDEAPAQSTKGSPIEQQLHSLTDELAQRRDTRVVLKTFGLGKGQVPAELVETVTSSAIQLIRNSIVHGALTPAQRLAKGKPDYLTITVSFTPTESGHTLIVRDDGEGLNEPVILARAKESGLITEAMAEDPPAGLARKLIFHSGFSSKEDTDLDGGRGVGLNAVYSMVKQAGGAIGLRSQPGSFCQFSLTFNEQQ